MALSYLIESFRGTDCGYCVPGTPFMGRSVLLASALLGSSLLQPAHGDSVQAEGFAAKAERGGKGDTRKISGMSANSSDLQGPVPATWRRLWRRTEAGAETPTPQRSAESVSGGGRISDDEDG